ncbi:MAG TPA: lytic transglycosylase domain-containing protein [Gammaproteobacteria bacterium]|nr:lytic transglycosylase domain-containing protein [Gammaproteobacteria bacterium]
MDESLTHIRPAIGNRKRKLRKKHPRRFRFAAMLPSAGTRRKWWRAFRRTPAFVQVIVGVAVVAMLWLAVNGAYQVVRKPSELFFPVSGRLYKTPSQTWRTYAPLFRRHATEVITPDLLAALAQVEGSGNPIVRTYWRWTLTRQPFEVYRPASSAVGMYQLTNGTFAQARRYCIRRNAVVEDGPWHDFQSCWFNSLYTRVVPSHAIELTSAYLDRQVTQVLERHGIARATLEQKQNLAAVIHLCGAGAGSAYARRGLVPSEGQRCGDHDLGTYLAKIDAMKTRFARLDAE